VLSGAGMPTQTWTYNYSPANQSWSNDECANSSCVTTCASSGTCPTTVYTDVTDPNGNDTRYTFSNRFDATEGLLQETDYYSGSTSGTLLRSEINTYAGPTGGPWPATYGFDLLYRDNQAQATELSPLSQRTITEEGDTYTWLAEAFNAYAQVTKTKRYNSIGFQQPFEEQTSYLNDPVYWVLGLPQEIDNLSTGETESVTTYSAIDTLLSRSRFGQTLMNYTFNSVGQLASFTDGNNHTTSLSNYYRGVPQLISYPDKSTESLTVDDLSQITSITDQNGHTTGYSYDPIGRIAGITYPTGDPVALYPATFTYSFVTSAERGVAASHWRRTKTTGSAVDTTYFDAMLRPVLNDTSIPGTEITTGTAYDWKGQTTFTSYPVSGAPAVSGLTSGTHSTYDALERLTQSTQDSELGALTTQTAYTGSAHKVVTDPKGNVTTTFYQVFDQPSYDTPIGVVAPAGIGQNISRDLYGNPTVINQAGMYGSESDSLSKYFYYDSYHRLCRTSEPESGSVVTTYDGANNVQTTATGLSISGTGCGTSPAASQTAYTYDAMNRVLTIQPPAGTQSTTYTYDPMGHLATASSGISYWWAYYNTLGNITGEALWLTGQSAWGIGYSYDAYGHLSAVGYPGGESVVYAPDPLGRATQAGSYASAVTYFPNQTVSSFTFGNGNVYVAELNARQSLANFSYGTSNTVSLSEDLIYDANGNITNVNDLLNGPRTKAFGYDALNRLISAQASGLSVNETYTYDALNNLRSRLTGGVTFNFNYDANNRLNTLTTAAGTSATYTYDAFGNRQSAANGSATTSYVFDAKNQLLQIPGVDTYAYDASGRRVAKTTANGSTTYSFYNKSGQLMYQAVPSSGQATNFIYLGSKLIARDVYAQLAAPASVTFDANPNNGSYTVSWGAVPAATSYNVQESANGGTWTAVYAGSGTSVALSGRAGGSYGYQVQGCTSAGCGPWTSSATLGVRPALATITVPSGTVNGTYTVSWTVPVSATTFDVQESVNGGAWTTIASATTATSIARPGTTSGSYTYQVDANNAYGNRGWASSSAVTVNTSYGVVPSTPTSFTVPASSTTGSATLSWGAANSVTSYTVQQSTNGGGSWSTVYTGASTSTALSGLADGSYTYQVQACNQYGCSAWVRGGTLTVLLPPPEPASITSPATSNGPVPLSWAASATATSYTLQHAIFGSTGWSTIYTGTATSFTQNETVTSAGWIYEVQACNSSGCSAFRVVSGGTSVTIPPSSAPSLTVPSSSNSGSYTVSWSAVTGASTYTLQQQLNGGAWSTIQATSSTSDSVSGEGNGSYGYQVQACNAGGCGSWSGVGTVSVLLVPITPTLTVKQSPGASNHILASLTWTAEPNATTYVVQEESGATIEQVYSGSNTTWSIGYTGALSSFRVEACNSSGCSPWTGWQ
jgi:YD repeat-containing protein